MISLRNITSPSESSRVSGLDALSLTINEGDVVSVVGLSSAGRRHLLGVLGLYTDDWSGEYELFGHAIHELGGEERAGLRGELVGAMMRSTPLVDCLSVEENLEIPLSFRGIPSRERSGMIDDALSRLGVQAIRDRDVDSLPADQMQLVGIAKALVSNPRLVLLEEPTRHLSQLQVRLVAREIARLRETGCIVVQSHDAPGAEIEVDRVITLDECVVERKARRRPTATPGYINRLASAWVSARA